ncbi:hypothetical protein [Actinomadura parmotrematis]|uniref:SMI1/KNR4 family protein n=1 Tax=Actinomadura parmotrematis TaxID=2864039 RepID=A0ABS7FRM9_9ACTN|nr:hypothetical protein [Actinomadura parmotrematis]MBW8483016.1 hypothetical protein [Actinomadura parmotrematis]
MGEIIDYGRFAERRRAGGRWEALRRLQEEWGYRVPEGAEPWRRELEDEHRAYVRDLAGRAGDTDPGLPVPAALEEWWDLPFNSFTHSPGLYGTNPAYPPTLCPDPDGYNVSGGLPAGSPYLPANGDARLCMFMAENQHCNEWAYLAAESGEDDPKVLVGVGDDEWEFQAASISEFFLLLAVDRLCSHFGWTAEEDADEALLDRVRARYPSLGLAPWRELGAEVHLYGGPDVILFHEAGDSLHRPGLLVCGRTEDAVRAAARALGEDWEVFRPEALPPLLALAEGDEGDGWAVAAVLDEPLEAPAPEAGGLRATIDADGYEPAVVIGSGGGVRVEEADEGVAQVAERRPAVRAVAAGATSAGPAFAAVWEDGLARLWDVGSGESADVRLGPGIAALAFAPDGRLRAGGPTGTAVLDLDPRGLWPFRSVLTLFRRLDWDALGAPAFPGLFAAARGGDAAAVADLDALLAPGGDLSEAASFALLGLLAVAERDGDGPVHAELLDLAARIVAAALAGKGDAPGPVHGAPPGDRVRELAAEVRAAFGADDVADDPAMARFLAACAG